MTGRALRILIEANTEPDEDGCLIWTGSRMRPGIPRMPGREDNRSARRVVYEEYNGTLPQDGLRRRVFPRCGVKLCVSPEHLIALTYQEQKRFEDASKSVEVVLQIDVRENGTAYAYALNAAQERRLKRLRGVTELGNGEFELPVGTVKLIGMRSNETKRKWVYETRERLGDARSHSSQLSSTERGWRGFRAEEEQALGIAEDMDVG